MLITETCATCKEMVMSMTRYGCRTCQELGQSILPTFCSPACVDLHKIDAHAPKCCGVIMQYDPGQPMSRTEPDIPPEFYCECGETMLIEVFLKSLSEYRE